MSGFNLFWKLTFKNFVGGLRIMHALRPHKKVCFHSNFRRQWCGVRANVTAATSKLENCVFKAKKYEEKLLVSQTDVAPQASLRIGNVEEGARIAACKLDCTQQQVAETAESANKVLRLFYKMSSRAEQVKWNSQILNSQLRNLVRACVVAPEK